MTEQNILSVDAIKEAADVTESVIPVPEWGGSVRIRSITKREMNDIKSKSRDAQGDIDEDQMEKWIFLTGLKEPAFEETDYEWLLDKSFTALTNITKAIMKGSNLDEGALKKEERNFRTEQ